MVRLGAIVRAIVPGLGIRILFEIKTKQLAGPFQAYYTTCTEFSRRHQ